MSVINPIVMISMILSIFHFCYWNWKFGLRKISCCFEYLMGSVLVSVFCEFHIYIAMFFIWILFILNRNISFLLFVGMFKRWTKIIQCENQLKWNGFNSVRWSSYSKLNWQKPIK